MPRIKTVYLVGPIEFLKNPDAGWRYDLAKELKDKLNIESINPVTISHLVGKDICDNMVFAATLKKERRLSELDQFINKKIWPINEKSVDDCDAIVTLAKTEEELKALSNSGGTIRELARAVDNQGKPAYLICECEDLTPANTHVLGLFLRNGAIFRSRSELAEFLVRYNRSEEWI